jgi:RND family efflux transporter MFP subunit
MPTRPLVCLALALLFSGCRPSEPAAAPSVGPVVSVRTSTVAAEQLPLFIEIPATIHPAARAVIAARLTGTIATLPWGLGQSVKAGDMLLILSAPEAEARVRQSQAQAAEATRTAERERTLVAKGVSPSDSLRDAEDRLRFAQAAVAEAEAMLAYATVRAPFDGVVTEKHVLPGDLATPGLPLLVIESTRHLRAEGNIPETLAAGLHLGDTLSVVVDEPPATIAGAIEELSTASDAVSRSWLAKVALPSGAVRSGQYVRLQVPAGQSAALLIPAGAVSLFGQMERVFLVEQGRAVLRLVKTGRVAGGRIEILAGINAGEQVVLAPPAALRDGSPVASQP